MYIHTIPNFFSEERCKKIIEFADNHPGTQHVKEKTSVHPNKCRLRFRDEDLANELKEKILNTFPKFPNTFDFTNVNKGDVWTFQEIYDFFKIYRYGNGQSFKRHQDAQSTTGKNVFSMMRLLIYLNESFVGGETVFDLGRKIKPKTGLAALFKMEYFHYANLVDNGMKYVLVCDLLFSRNKKND